MTEHELYVEDLRVVAAGRAILAVDRLGLLRGEVVGVLGPNGSGKTTLLRACLGFCRIAGGRVTLLGRRVAELGSLGLARLRQQVAYMPQAPRDQGFVPLTVREVVAMGRTGRAGLLRPLGGSHWRTVEAWIERLGLAALRNHPYAELSGGEQRRVLIARAMAQEPAMLMLDEPAAHLDLGVREQIVRLMDDIYAAQRPTMLIICHELEVLPRCCDRVVLLEDGRVRADGRPEVVLSPAWVRATYGAGLAPRHAHGRHAIIPVEGEGLA